MLTTVPATFKKTELWLGRIGQWIQPALLLLIRLWWGWSFFLTGKGKLLHLERTAEYFATLHLPLPTLSALLAGSTECVGGLLLLLGLGARFVSAPLIGTMLIAYATAEREALGALASDPDKFTGAAPFQFLLACLVVLAFGPGGLSLDHWLGRRQKVR